jgi:hypothetical protein
MAPAYYFRLTTATRNITLTKVNLSFLINRRCGSSKVSSREFTARPTGGKDGEDRPAGLWTRFGFEGRNAFRRLVRQECSCSGQCEFSLDGSKQEIVHIDMDAFYASPWNIEMIRGWAVSLS